MFQVGDSVIVKDQWLPLYWRGIIVGPHAVRAGKGWVVYGKHVITEQFGHWACHEDNLSLALDGNDVLKGLL